MFRVLSIGSLSILLIMVLYLPAAYTPVEFVQQIRVEHDAAMRFWQGDFGTHILARTLVFVDATPRKVPLMPPDKPRPPPSGAVALEVGRVGNRMIDNAYVRSLNGLLALSAYRLATLIEWLPCFAVLLLASFIDGAIRRAVKRKEFLRHSPEIFGVCTCLLVVTICMTVLSLVLPWTAHPLLAPIMLLFMCVLINLGVANYVKA